MQVDKRGPAEASRPPVTVLCGFLGAGKTTVLNHLLTQSQGERWALVVNDVGAINIDARLVALPPAPIVDGSSGVQPAAQPVVELGNGCVCCSIKDELAETVARLALTGRPGGPAGLPYDHILIETTGVAEPRGVARLFLQPNPFGRALGDLAVLHALVTVIDAAHFLQLWREQVAGTSVLARPRREILRTSTKPWFELMLEQVETADLLLVNQCDRVSGAERSELTLALRGLNPRAEIQEVEHGRVPRAVVLAGPRFDAQATLGASTWLQTLNALAPAPGRFVQRPGGAPVVDFPLQKVPHGRHGRRFGLDSFVFQARRPMVRERLEALLTSGVPGLVRAKGFCWWAEQPDEMGFLSVAGGAVRIDLLNYWWAALIESGRASLEDRPPLIRALWEEPGGDRRQELVFIGVDLDRVRLTSALEACLVP